jgi:hypothetical protein
MANRLTARSQMKGKLAHPILLPRGAGNQRRAGGRGSEGFTATRVWGGNDD